MTGVKLYDELAGMAECVPLQRKHFNDEKGEHCIAVKRRPFGIFSRLKSGLILQFQFSMQLFSLGYGIRIRIGKAKVVLKKGKKMKKFHVWSVICWAGVFCWSLDVLHDGLSCNRSSLQFSTENGRNMKFFTFFWLICAFLDPDPQRTNTESQNKYYQKSNCAATVPNPHSCVCERFMIDLPILL